MKICSRFFSLLSILSFIGTSLNTPAYTLSPAAVAETEHLYGILTVFEKEDIILKLKNGGPADRINAAQKMSEIGHVDFIQELLDQIESEKDEAPFIEELQAFQSIISQHMFKIPKSAIDSMYTFFRQANNKKQIVKSTRNRERINAILNKTASLAISIGKLFGAGTGDVAADKEKIGNIPLNESISNAQYAFVFVLSISPAIIDPSIIADHLIKFGKYLLSTQKNYYQNMAQTTLIDAIKKGNKAQKIEAIKTIECVEIFNRNSFQFLVGCVYDSDEDVALAAQETLMKKGTENYIVYLRREINGDIPEGFRQRLINVVYGIGKRILLDSMVAKDIKEMALGAVLRYSSNVLMRRDAVTMMLNKTLLNIEGLSYAVLYDPDYIVRTKAMTCIGLSDMANFIPIIEIAVRKKRLGIREESIAAASLIGGQGGQKILCDVVNNRWKYSRKSRIQALIGLSRFYVEYLNEEVVNTVALAMSSKNENISTTAIKTAINLLCNYNTYHDKHGFFPGMKAKGESPLTFPSSYTKISESIIEELDERLSTFSGFCNAKEFIRALAYSRTKEATDELLFVLLQKNWNVVLVDYDSNGLPIQNEISVSYQNVRRKCVDALGLKGDVTAVEPLISMLHEENADPNEVELRARIPLALFTIFSQQKMPNVDLLNKVENELIVNLDNENEPIRKEAWKVLSKLQGYLIGQKNSSLTTRISSIGDLLSSS